LRNCIESSSGSAARLALRVQRGAQEIGVVDARDLDRILEREEQPERSARLGLELEQVPALELHRARGDLVALATGQHVAQRGLAGAVRTHDRVHLARVHREREALQDFLARDPDMEVVDLQHALFIRSRPRG
jgi:hypothetical protein